MTDPIHQCPRCDYDLSGQIAAWQAECPLDGQCPECGLTFTWSDLFNTEPPPAWSFEHSKGSIFTLTWSFVRSVARVLLPTRLWSSLKLAFPIVPSRLIQLAILGPLLVHVFIASLVAASVGVQWWFKNNTSNRWFDQGIFDGVGKDFFYSLGNNWLNIFFPYATISRAGGSSFDTPLGATLLVLSFAAFLPAAFLLLPATMRRAKVRTRHLARIGAYWLICVPALAMCFPIVKLAEHGATSMTSSILSTSAWRPGMAYASLPGVHATQFLRSTGPILALAVVLSFSWWFWSTASARYLRLPRARLDTAVLVLVAALTALAFEFLTGGGERSVTIQLLRSFFPGPTPMW